MANTIDEDVSSLVTADIQKLWKLVLSGRSSGHYYVLLLGLRKFDTATVLERVSHGLSYSCFTRLSRNSALPTTVLSELIQVSDRTLARRKEKGRLYPDESDRLLRVSRIIALVLALFEGDRDQARRWLSTEQPALGGATPLEFAKTELGAREVEDLIGRLEHGVPS